MSQVPRWLAGVWLAILCMACGCSIPFSQHPTVQPEEAKAYPKLYGAYRFEPRDDKARQGHVFFHLGGAGDKFPPGFLRGIQVSLRNSELEMLQFVAFAEKIGDYYIFNVPLSEESLDSPRENGDSIFPLRQEWDPENAKNYLLFRGSWDDGEFRLVAWNGPFIAEEIEAERLKGTVKTREEEGETRLIRVSVTAETAELRSFIERHIEDPKLWPKESEAIFRRME